MANSLADFMSDPNLGGSTPGNSLIPMVRGNFSGSPDELEKIRQFAMSLPDPQQRNQLLAALQNNVNPMDQGPQMPPVPQPNQGELTRRQGGMFNYDENTGSFRPGGNVSRSDGQNYNLGPQQATPSDMAKAALMEKLRGTQNVPAEDFNSSAMDALYDPQTGSFRSGGAVRDNQTGKVTALGGGAPRQQGPVISYGVGNGGITQLKDGGGMPEADYSRAQVTIPGLGKGHYSTDGAYVVGEYDNGVRWKALLGYDHAATQQAKADSMGMEKLRLGNEKTQAEINNLNLKPTGPADSFTMTPDGQLLNTRTGELRDTGAGGTVGRQQKTAAYNSGLKELQKDDAAVASAGALADAYKEWQRLQPNVTTGRVAGMLPAIGQPDRQRLLQLENFLAVNNFKPGQGAISNFERGLIKGAGPSVNNDAETNDAIIKVGLGAVENMKDRAMFREAYLQGRGNLLGSDQAWQKYLDKNPRVTKAENGQIVDNPNRMGWQDYFANGKATSATPSTVMGQDQSPQLGRVNPGDAIFQAKKALRAGANRSAVIQRLEQSGITNHGL